KYVEDTHLVFLFFFFQAEDGIRDKLVTGVQTCALPISHRAPRSSQLARRDAGPRTARLARAPDPARDDRGSRSTRRWLPGGRRKIGRASCRERVWNSGVI